MSYTITAYTRGRAKALGVSVKRSTNKKKKIDVFKDGKKVASVGAIGYGDFPTFKKTKGKEYADKRRRQRLLSREALSCIWKFSA